MQKHCAKCGETKPQTEFAKQTKQKDGLCPYCKACRRAACAAWREANPEKVKAAAKRRIADGRAKLQTAEYKKRNPEKVRAYAKRKYAENADQVKCSLQRWAEQNPDRLREKRAAWRKANPESVKASKHRNRAKRRQAPGSHTARELMDLFSKQRGMCAVCRAGLPKHYHVDHIQPLAGGGSNDITNIQLLCRVCNQAKSAKDPIAFMQQKGFLL